MQKPILLIHKSLGFIERGFALVAGITIMVLMLVVCAEVFGRSALNAPIRGNIDMVSQLMAVAAAGGIAYTQSKHGNVRMTILSARLSRRGKWVFEALALAVAWFAIFTLMRGSYGFLMRAWRSGADSPEINIPTWIGIGFVTVALGLLLARLSLQLFEALRLTVSPGAESQVFGTEPASAAPINTTGKG
jgi:TRAP-type C4-dicarboxylate transport system permease small subunit